MSGKDQFGNFVDVNDTVCYVRSGRYSPFKLGTVLKTHQGGGVDIEQFDFDYVGQSKKPVRRNITRFVKYIQP